MKLCVPLDLLEEIPLSGPEMFNTLPPLEDQRQGSTDENHSRSGLRNIFGCHLFQWVRTEREKDTLSEPPYIEHTVS